MPFRSRTLTCTATLAGALFAAFAHAQPQPSTLEQVVQHTLLTNPEIQVRYQDFRSSLEGQKIARGAYLPEVNARGFIGREYRSNLPNGESSYDWNRPGYTLELRQLIFDGFKTTNDIKQAGYDKLARFYDLLATSDETAYAAVQAYIDLQRYTELERLARQNFDLHVDTQGQIRERSESGVGRRVDSEQAAGRVALAQSNLMTESANLIDVQQRYIRITGLSPSTAQSPVPAMDARLPVQPRNFNDSLRLNPSILSKQADLQAAQAGNAASKGAFSPKFEFVAATGTDRSQPEYDYRNVQSSSVQLVMSYNLYRGGADSARVRQTAAQSYAARDLRDYTCRNVQQDLAVAWNNVVRLREQLPFLREHELATAKVREAYMQQFQIGQRSLLDLLDTENELFESRRALIAGEYDLQLAQYRWLSLSHKLLPALGLRPASDELPDEAKELELTDEVIALCNSTVPDPASLAPVQVSYRDGQQPPSLTGTARN